MKVTTLRIRLHRLGSDPEFLFAHPNGTVVPASTVVGPQGNQFVGFDGHNATGELRPRPFFNIKGQMFDLATAIHEISNMVPNLVLVARPFYANEPLGGHIHVSGFAQSGPIPSGIASLLREYGLMIRDGGLIHDPENKRTRSLETGDYTLLTEFARSTSFEGTRLGTILSYLLHPFEVEVQPADERISRNNRYGTPHDVRTGVSKPTMLLSDATYWHYEYRMPSTWLNHPRLAYAYFALAKLSMLNLAFIETQPSVKLVKPILYFEDERNSVKKTAPSFWTRYNNVMANSPRLTPDLHLLPQVLETVFKDAKTWFSRLPVYVGAWRKLLG